VSERSRRLGDVRTYIDGKNVKTLITPRTSASRLGRVSVAKSRSNPLIHDYVREKR
jgi:hypothetical protein